MTYDDLFNKAVAELREAGATGFEDAVVTFGGSYKRTKFVLQGVYGAVTMDTRKSTPFVKVGVRYGRQVQLHTDSSTVERFMFSLEGHIADMKKLADDYRMKEQYAQDMHQQAQNLLTNLQGRCHGNA